MSDISLPTVVHFAKLHPDAIIPKFAHQGDAGMDLIACENSILLPKSSALIHTGIAINLPPNTEAQVRPRSGLALKHQITVLNTPGTIDEGYRGEIGVILINHGNHEFKIDRGMKIAQLVIKPTLTLKIEEVAHLDNTTPRGASGFGSTGN